MVFKLWDKRKNEDYYFIDGVVSEMFSVGGTSVLVHKYLGPNTANSSNNDATQPKYDVIKETNIQDILFLENRNRKYDKNVYDLNGIYKPGDAEFDLSQFSIMLSGDTIFIEIHLNDCVKALGRKIMSGDVIELPHQRDTDTLGDEAINRFYVVDDVGRAADGYSPTWWPHILRVKCNTLKDSPEFAEILNKKATDLEGNESNKTLKDLLSTYGKDLEIADAVLEQANIDVDKRNFDTTHLYIKQNGRTEGSNLIPYIVNGDGKPVNGQELSGSGNYFPDSPIEGDYFLRTDYKPNRLFWRQGGVWVAVEDDYRGSWQAAHRILESFVNNNNTTKINCATEETIPEKTPLSKVIKPKVD